MGFKLFSNKKKRNIYDDIKLAQEEIKRAEEYINNVTDPKLIDYGIYRLKAAKAHYSYLLNKIKKEKSDQNTPFK